MERERWRERSEPAACANTLPNQTKLLVTSKHCELQFQTCSYNHTIGVHTHTKCARFPDPVGSVWCSSGVGVSRMRWQLTRSAGSILGTRL